MQFLSYCLTWIYITLPLGPLGGSDGSGRGGLFERVEGIPCLRTQKTLSRGGAATLYVQF